MSPTNDGNRRDDVERNPCRVTTPILIVADDLTGALDSAAPFAARGLHVRVALGVDAAGEAAAAAPDVLAIDTRSRALAAPLAAERIEAAWHAARILSPHIVMKKVDSRLKGEVAAETAALLAASRRSAAIVCPAVPDQERRVTGGHLAGRGVATPVAVADRFAGLPCECPDAADAADLETIARGIMAAPDRIMAVGARGLAAALADVVAGPPISASAPVPALPMVIAIGSTDPITGVQVERLRLECPHVKEMPALEASPHMPGRAVILLSTAGHAASDPAALAARFGREAAAMVRAASARTLLCSGGDTAAAVMDALDARQLIVEHELDSGVPVARIEGLDGLRLVTKSGGFGDPDLLSRIVRDATAGVGQVAA